MSSFRSTSTKEEQAQRGVIVEVLPKAMYRVQLDSGREVRVSVSARARHTATRFVAGDAVLVEVSGFDPTRGKIAGRSP